VNEKCNINLRGIDRALYQQFKSVIYQQGAKNVKQAIVRMMEATIEANKNR
jgi:hypothetical protein